MCVVPSCVVKTIVWCPGSVMTSGSPPAIVSSRYIGAAKPRSAAEAMSTPTSAATRAIRTTRSGLGMQAGTPAAPETCALSGRDRFARRPAQVGAQYERGPGEDGEAEGDVRQRVGGRGERAPEDEPDERERGRPGQRAEQAPRDETAGFEARRAGEERRDRAHDADEAPGQDGRRPVALHEALDVREALVGHAHAARAGRAQEAHAEPPAEEVADEVAERGGGPDDREQERELHLAAGGDDAAEDDGGLARRDEADEGARLQEGEAGDERVRP